MTVVNKNTATKAGLLLSYYITLSFWSAQTLALSMVSRNIAGATKKSTTVAMTFISWAVGNAIGLLPFLSFSGICIVLTKSGQAHKSSSTTTLPVTLLPLVCISVVIL